MTDLFQWMLLDMLEREMEPETSNVAVLGGKTMDEDHE
jgi:hypothetical protein